MDSLVERYRRIPMDIRDCFQPVEGGSLRIGPLPCPVSGRRIIQFTKVPEVLSLSSQDNGNRFLLAWRDELIIDHPESDFVENSLIDPEEV